jgi:hypothetical protein
MRDTILKIKHDVVVVGRFSRMASPRYPSLNPPESVNRMKNPSYEDIISHGTVDLEIGR